MLPTDIKLKEGLVSMFAAGIIVIEVWPTDMPVWAFVLALVSFCDYIIIDGPH